MPPVFDYLIDEPEDGTLDSEGWLHASLAETPAGAVETFARLYDAAQGPGPWDEEGVVLACERREWLRATYHRTDDDDLREVELVGLAAERAASDDDRTDELRWDRCEETADGADEWWLLEVRA